MKKYFYVLLIIMLVPFSVRAEESKELTSSCKVLAGDKANKKIVDSDYGSFTDYAKDTKINITCEDNINYVYIYYNVKPTKGHIGKKEIGQNGYLHELIKLDKETKELSIEYDDEYSIADIYLFTKGDLPSWVEDWQTLTDQADLMLISTHADDEQLFFAGLLPLYADAGKKIEVIYFTNHYNNTMRYHEQLEGLWTVGIKYYPVISTFPDEYSESLEDAIANLKKAGFGEEDAMKYLVWNIRRFKPKVIVGHDEKGEYGHGQHILSTYILKDAIKKAGDKSFEKESAKNFGLWMPYKLYLHLYKDKQVTLDYDKPLDTFGGKTAFEVSKEGFAKHYSQQYTWFTAWLNGEDNEFKSATEIKEYNPAIYGLFYSSVGDDKNKNDLFENIKEKKEEPTEKKETKTKKVTPKVHKKHFNNSEIKSLKIIGIVIGVTLVLMYLTRPKKKKKKKKKTNRKRS